MVDLTWVEIVRARNPIEAEVIRGLLESHDIPCIVKSHVVPYIHPSSLGPMAEAIIVVPAEDRERALAVLEGAEEAGEE